MRHDIDWIHDELPEFDDIADWTALPAALRPVHESRGEDMVFRGLLETDVPPDSVWRA